MAVFTDAPEEVDGVGLVSGFEVGSGIIVTILSLLQYNTGRSFLQTLLGGRLRGPCSFCMVAFAYA